MGHARLLMNKADLLILRWSNYSICLVDCHGIRMFHDIGRISACPSSGPPAHTDNEVECVIAGVLAEQSCVGHMQVPQGSIEL